MSNAEREVYWSQVPAELRKEYESAEEERFLGDDFDDTTLPGRRAATSMNTFSVEQVHADTALDLPEDQQVLEQKRWSQLPTGLPSALAVGTGPSPYASDEEIDEDDEDVNDYLMINDGNLDLGGLGFGIEGEEFGSFMEPPPGSLENSPRDAYGSQASFGLEGLSSALASVSIEMGDEAGEGA